MNTRDTFTVTFDWMLDLPLDIWETTIFAVIWGFTQDGETVFNGSRAYLARKAKCSQDKVDKSTKKLIALGLIEKRDVFANGIKFCQYRAQTEGGRWERVVAAANGRVAADNGEGSRCERHNNIGDNAGNKLPANRESSAPARVNNFDFKKSLLDMGVTEQHAADWLQVRKVKRMTNTKTAFERLKVQIEKACKHYGVTPDDCVAFAASKDWGGFDANWEQVKDIINNTATNGEDRVRRAYAAAEAKFKGGVHF